MVQIYNMMWHKLIVIRYQLNDLQEIRFLNLL